MTLALLIAAVLASSGLFSPGQGAAEETPGLTRQDEKPRDSHLLFVDRVYAALNDPGNGPLDAALLEAPYRALLLVQDLLYKAALDPESPYILQAARRIAERASAVLEDSTALDAIARFDAFSSEDRARRVEIETLLLEATTAFQQNPLSLALEPCLDALDIAEALQEPFLKARACLLLGRIEENRNNREKAESLFLTALALDRLLQLTTRQVWDCCFLGDMEFKAGRHAAALAWYDQALPHASTAGDLLAEGILTANMGALLSFLGRYEEAEQALSRALTLSRDLLDRPREAYVLSAWGSLKSGMGDYAEAIRFMIEAVEAWRATGDPDREAGALLDLAGVYSEVGQTADAEDCIAGALERLPTGSGPQEKARALVTQGLCNLDEQEYEKAILFLDQAIAFLEADQGPALAEALKHRGTALLELGDAKQAEKEFTRAYEINAEKGNQYSAVLCLIGQGTALTQMHEAAQAEKVIETALHEADAMGLPELIWRASYRRGVLSESKGEDREALHHYLKAIENVEKMRRRLAAPVLLDRYLGDKLSLYRCAARLTAEQGDLESAFKLAEAGKARTLLRLSAAHPSHALHDNSLSQKLKACEAELNLLERRITESLQFSSSENEGTRADLEQRLRKARAEHKAARLRCELEAPRTTGLSGLGDPPSLEEVQQALSVDDAMLEYLAGPEGIYLFVITKDRARFVDLAVPEAHIAEWVKRILEPMDQLKQGSIDVANLFFDAKAALNLYQALIAPIRGDLGSCRHLMVLPDGCLRKLPFSLLVSAREKRRVEPDRLFAQYRGCRFLIEELSISYLPTAGLLISPAPGPRVDSEKASVVMMADPDPMPHGAKPLPGARTETEMALRCFRVDRARLFTGAEASEANLKGITSSPALLHLACHASLNDRRPAYSRLALAPGQGEDGWLHAFEIERLTMNARLVVLSACETMGSQGRGEGLLGLCRAFLQSGASSVLATAWMVDDQATAMLMGRFYLALASGKTPANALQSAQQYVIRKGSRPGMNLIHPFFWAGFMHTGVDE